MLPTGSYQRELGPCYIENLKNQSDMDLQSPLMNIRNTAKTRSATFEALPYEYNQPYFIIEDESR